MPDELATPASSTSPISEPEAELDQQLSDPTTLYDDDLNIVEPEAAVEEPAPVAEATPEPEPEPEAVVHPPLAYAPSLPPDMYTPAELEQLKVWIDDPDPATRLYAQQFMANRTAEYQSRAMLVTQAQTAKLPQRFMASHGLHVMEALNTRIAPADRGTEEGLRQAVAYSVHARAQQIGLEDAYREAADLLSTTPKPAAPPKPPAQPAAPLRPEQRMPSPTVGTPAPAYSGAGAGNNGRTREDMARNRVLKGLGIDGDD